jgi:hypothetical protein
MNVLDIKQEHYFPFTFRILGVILMSSGPLIYISQPHTTIYWLMIVLLPILGLVLLTSRYGLIIDINHKSYKVYSWWLGHKSGKSESFAYIEKFYINEVTEAMTMNTRTGAQYDIKKRQHMAFMKLDHGEKVHVDTDTSYEALKERVAKYTTACRPVMQSSN